MAFLTWIALGLLAGFVAGKVENKRRKGVALDLPLGIIGAVVAGLVFDGSGLSGTHEANLYSLFVALVGSVSVLAIYHLMIRRA